MSPSRFESSRNGVFTLLLAELLPPGSDVYAVDRNAAALNVLLRKLGQVHTTVNVHTLQADFTQPLDLPPLDGILMANSLHFVRDKEPVLRRLCGLLCPGGCLVIIEYNTRRGNGAVPYPRTMPPSCHWPTVSDWRSRRFECERRLERVMHFCEYGIELSMLKEWKEKHTQAT